MPEIDREWPQLLPSGIAVGTRAAHSRKPLCIDLYAGLGGWTEGFLAEGWDVVGFDNERHVYGDQRYPAQLVLQDVLTLNGRQFRNADCIVASPPCQEFSYMAMPWSRAKQIAGALRGEVPFPEGYTGSRTVAELTALFDACFRIQREACEAAGRYIPMVVENVRGAQPWVGKARANFGSFYFWGDVAMVGGQVVTGRPQFGQTVKAARRGMKRNPDGTEHPQGSWFAIADSKERGNPGGSFQTAAVTGVKLGPECDESYRFTEPCPGTGVKNARNWWSDGEGSLPATTSSHGSARKAASAQIAKIPFPLSSYIARAFRP